jgi:hypothetical protein
MAQAYCNFCERQVDAKRKIGVGTLLLCLSTAGAWIWVIPYYGKRCSICETKSLVGADLIFVDYLMRAPLALSAIGMGIVFFGSAITGFVHPKTLANVSTSEPANVPNDVAAEGASDAIPNAPAVQTPPPPESWSASGQPLHQPFNPAPSQDFATAPASDNHPAIDPLEPDDVTHRRARSLGWCDAGTDPENGDTKWKRCG